MVDIGTNLTVALVLISLGILCVVAMWSFMDDELNERCPKCGLKTEEVGYNGWKWRCPYCGTNNYDQKAHSKIYKNGKP